jgi:two-component system, OmpR family, sensor histidine kinase MtrB
MNPTDPEHAPDDTGAAVSEVRARRQLPLRVRAGLAFGLMALVLSSALALAAHVLVRSSLVAERQIAAEGQAYTNARLLRSRIDPLPEDMSQLLAGLQVGGEGDSLLRVGDQWFSSSVQVTPSELPGSLLEIVEGGDAAIQRFDHSGSVALGVGVPVRAVDAIYFEVSSMAEVQRALTRLGRSLSIAAVVAAMLGGLLGAALSSVILQPLRRFALVAERITSSGRDPNEPAAGESPRLDAAGDADLEPLAGSFNEMLDELDERIERERRFASDVTHEIRGPLAALSSAVSIVDRRRQQLPEEIVPVVDALQEQVHAFNGLVLDLLEISRFDSRTAALDVSSVDLGQLCATLISSRGYESVTLTASGVTTAEVDRRRIEQVLSNLLENADHYAGGATDLTVEARRDAHDLEVVRLVVEDRGPGVSPSETEAIFERFERGHAASAPDAPRGTGLGLALSRQHVELHGGRIWVEDRAGGGASFVVELPREQA